MRLNSIVMLGLAMVFVLYAFGGWSELALRGLPPGASA